MGHCLEIVFQRNQERQTISRIGNPYKECKLHVNNHVSEHMASLTERNIVPERKKVKPRGAEKVDDFNKAVIRREIIKIFRHKETVTLTEKQT